MWRHGNLKNKIIALLMCGVCLLGACGQQAPVEHTGTTESESAVPSESVAQTGESTVIEESQSEPAEEIVEVDWYQQMLETSILSTGTNGRLEKVLDKMKKGERVTVALIGGSVTEGAGAANYKECYGDRFAQDLQEAYPKADIHYVNAGLGGTPSSLGIIRYERDVIIDGEEPDLVVIEFAVNDWQEATDGRAYESMIRKIMESDKDPAVVLLFAVFQSKWNLQDNYIKMGELYGLPMVSIKDAIVKPYADGEITDKQFFADEYHPTSYGHEIMADCLGELVAQVSEQKVRFKVDELPTRSVKDLDFVDVHMLTSANEKGFEISEGSFNGRDTQVQNTRAGKNSFPDNWMHTGENGNDALKIKLNCKNIMLNYKTSWSQEYGTAVVYVDGKEVTRLNGYSSGGWNNSNVVLVLDEAKSAEHVLEIKMAEGDENKKFTLLTIGYSFHEPDGLYTVYKDNFLIGVAMPNIVVSNKRFKENILNDYNSMTCENEMKPDALLDQSGSQEGLADGSTYTHAAVKFNNCSAAVKFATENGIKIRLHTLVWHSQTPRWFFTEDYSYNGTLVSKEVMLQRMENYIADVLGYFDENYPELIYAVDVVNEVFEWGTGDENGIRMKDNLWYETVGPDYYYYAFLYARKYAPEYMKLFYNDYGCMDKTDLILKHLQKVQDEGLIDGIGMQSHLSTTDRIAGKFLLAVKWFCEAGYEVQITELDMGVTGKTDSAFMTQGRKYKVLFSGLKQLQEEGYNITSVTLWGLNDRYSWRAEDYCLLYDESMNPKPAYLGAMLDDSILNME